MKNFLITLSLAASWISAAAQGNVSTIVSSPAYRWTVDSIVQGPFKAYAVSEHEILSDYHAKPHYFMPIEPRWVLKNDISAYPKLETSNKLHAAIFNMGLDEMINAVEPDTTLRTGKEWAGVWTRDVSYSIILSMAYLQPEASKISLMKKVNSHGRIIQDTGSGGAWPVSSDRMVWAIAAYELYKVTGDRDWLEYIYPVIKNSFADDFLTTHSAAGTGLVKGETSFIDWREQSYPKWMQTADIYQSEALGTSVVHAAALNILSKIASDLGKKEESVESGRRGKELTEAINKEFWMPKKGYYAMYLYGRDFPIVNPRAETLGESLAILYNIASPEQAVEITENNPVTPYGPAIFFPQISDIPSYHNNALWPFVASFWTLANAKAGNEQGTLQGIGSVFRPAALFATNKENFNLDNGDIETELNSSNMLWSLSGNLAITCRILFGIHFEENGLLFKPFVPKVLADNRSLDNFPYRGAKLNIRVKGYGDKIKSMTLNGKSHEPFIAADELRGNCEIVIELADNEFPPMKVNYSSNVKAPITPITWVEDNVLNWNPIEYIGHYVVLRNGKPIGETESTSWAMTIPGEYQVIGVSGTGVESFASEPRSNTPRQAVELPGESLRLNSKEISYMPEKEITGWHGAGFVETDHSATTLEIPVKVGQSGVYSVKFLYANGNGPVNTENKCCIRTLYVDGKRVGTVVMPTRGVGRWSDWGASNSLKIDLSAGAHTLELKFNPENENMNLSTNHAIIDSVILTELKSDSE